MNCHHSDTAIQITPSSRISSAYVHLLNEVAIAANESQSVEAALRSTLRSICDNTGWPVGHALIKQADDALYSTALWHLRDPGMTDALAPFRQATEAQCFPPGIGLPGRVLTEGTPLAVTNTREEINFPRQAYALAAGLMAGFAFPIRSGSSTVAVLEFYSTALEQLSAELLEVMAQIGVLLGRVFERQAARQALEASERYSRQVIESSTDAFIAMDAQGVITTWNQAAETVFGWSQAEVLGKTVADTIVPEHLREAHRLGMARFLAHGKASVLGQRLELPALHRDGHEFPIEITLWSLEQEGEWSFYSFAHDITSRKLAEEALEHRALHDALTGLPNRTLALEWLQQHLDQWESSDGEIAVLFIDLDHFKRINDSFGHDTGDQVLITVAERLRQVMRPEDIVARLSGDEFVAACFSVTDYEDATHIAKRLQDTLTAPIRLNDDSVFVTASIGIAMTEPGCDAEKLIGSADIAMYQAKTSGRAGHALFDERMQMRVITRQRIENELHQALDRGEFQLYFQPIVSAATGAMVSLEALLRWKHPQRGLISPAEFIPIAEETGLIVPIGTWVIEEACRLIQSRQFHDHKTFPVGISVNLSARQLAQSNLTDTVDRIFRHASFDPARIEFCFEVTETSLMHDPVAAAERLNRLHDLGARIAIDDFGTGYSSMAYLKRFPVDTLKIDRLFVKSITEDAVDRAIVRSVTELAQGLRLSVVAEGVETEAQARVLRSLNVDLLQGFLYARPQPFALLQPLLQAARPI